VCTFGFEVNSRHSLRLQQLEAAYGAMGWRSRIFTDTGVSLGNGWAAFRSDGNLVMNEWGGSVDLLRSPSCAEPGAVRLVAAHEFFGALRRRQIPADPGWGRPPRVVAKLDIEGMDEAVLLQLATHGGLCEIDFLYSEHISGATGTAVAAMKEMGCNHTTLRLDDESYATTDYPLPQPDSASRPCAADGWTFGGHGWQDMPGHRDFTRQTCASLPNCGWCGNEITEGTCMSVGGVLGADQVSWAAKRSRTCPSLCHALTTQHNNIPPFAEIEARKLRSSTSVD